MHSYFIGIGSNHDAYRNLARVRKRLRYKFDNIVFSCVLKTKGIGLSFDCWYLNQMAYVKSDLSDKQIKVVLNELEMALGRKHHSRIVSIDLDMVRFDDVIVHKDYDKYPFLKTLEDDLKRKI